MPVRPPLILCLFGAPLDTGNRGVEALGRSVLSGVARSAPGSSVTIFDNGWGVRAVPAEHGDVRAELCGVRQSRRYYRRESWWNVRTSQHFGGLRSPVAERLRAADAVMDISGGDSFSDIYGPTRLRAILEPKLAALRARRPLVLLPQTYGPFSERGSRQLAQRVVQRASLAFSRDQDSHEALLELLADQVDESRHRAGVDVAFALDPCEASHRLGTSLRQVLDDSPRQRPLVGINVSGLLWDRTRSNFGLFMDYRATMQRLVERILAAGPDVVLVPHVIDVSEGRESDLRAAVAVRESCPEGEQGRVYLAPDDLNAAEAKWLISCCDWFCGTRMHSTIAALSSGVPTAAIAYSMKTRGVFATCGVSDEVVDARFIGAEEAVETLVDCFARREAVRSQLKNRVPGVVARATKQLAEIVAWVAASRTGARDAALGQ